MKIFLKILAWVGLLLIVLGLFLSFSSSSTWITTGQLGSGVGFLVTFCAGSLGTLLALLGGLIARPKYFWMGAIIVGVVYLSSFYGYFADWEPRYLPGVTVMLLPGAICVGLGLVLFRISKRKVG